MSYYPGVRPPGASQEDILRRLAAIDQKIDWIARRMMDQEQRGPEAESQPARHQEPGTSTVAASDPCHSMEKTAGASLPPTTSAAWPVTAPGTLPAVHVAATPASRTAAVSASTPTPMGPVAPRTVSPVGSFLPPRAGPVPPTMPVPRTPVAAAPVRTRPEGAVGRYLLSAAAALLVVLAAVTLLALVWDSIPDLVKVGGLALIAVGLVVGGTTLALRSPSQKVAAATLSGTGGALGFVAVVGAVLIQVGLPVLLAFALMSAWGVILLLLSRRTRQFFTAVISTVGALVTIGFASWHTDDAPQGAGMAWLLVCVYLTVLALTTTVLARRSQQVAHSHWYPVTSMVAAGFAVLMTPAKVVVLAPVLLASGLVLLPLVILVVQVVEAGPRLHVGGHYLFGVLDWSLVGLLTFVVLSRLLLAEAPWAEAVSGSSAVPVPAIMVLMILAGIALSLLPERAPARWRYLSACTQLVITGLLSVFITTSYPALLGLGALVVALSAAACAGCGSPVGLLALGLFAIASVKSHTGSVTGPLSMLIGLLVIIVATVLIERRIVATPTTVGAVSSDQVGQRPGAQAAARRGVLHTATWLMAVNLVGLLPIALCFILERMRVLESVASFLSVNGILTGTAALAVTALGIFAGARTPVALLSGQLAGRLAGAGEQKRPSPPALAWTGYTLLALLALQELVYASFTASMTWRALLVIMAVALVAAAVRCVRPWLARSGVSLAAAVLSSVCLWWSVVTLTEQGLVSVLMTIVILLTGAVCIILGFWGRATMLRHYGLALVLLAVLKLALLDIGNQSSITRVLALLAAGLVCFALSLAYNRAVNQNASAALSAESAQTGPVPPEHGRVPYACPQVHRPTQPPSGDDKRWQRPNV